MRRISVLFILLALALAAAAAAQSLSDLRRLANRAKEVAGKRKAAAAPATSSSTEADDAESAAGGIPEGTLMLSVKRNFSTKDNPLHSELSINGQLVNIFTAEAAEPVEQYFRPGWNTITLVTTPQEPSNDQNDLIFRIGPARRDPRAKNAAMNVLWQFRNGTDWKLREDGTWRHATGPKVKKVQMDLQVYYAGVQDEGPELQEGDLVLIAKPTFESNSNTSVSGTVFINGTPITTFLQPTRQLVITPYLKKGKNELKLVSARVKNGYVEDNDIAFTVAGPARWSATEEKYVVKPLVQFKAMQGWVRDSMSGQLINRADPKSERIERVIPLLLKDSDQPGGE